MKVKFLKGLPGSGKTTYAKKLCESSHNWVRVSRDDLRNMRGKYWIPRQEDMITDMELELILIALNHNKNVVVDATNFNKSHLDKIKSYVKNSIEINGDIEFETKFFDTPLKKCIERDLKRANSVGKKTIMKFYNKYLKKDITVKQDESLPKAIICDLDGTLCIHNGRSPYDYDKVDTDLLNPVIDKILYGYCEGCYRESKEEPIVIFLSGREDSCREETIKWLKKYFWLGSEDFLFMRKTGDHRKDYIVKQEIFEREIKDKYYIEFVLDDRNQVVDMWRDLGLTCLQVAEGDF